MVRTFWQHNGSELLIDKSNIYMFPSVVTAAKTVDEKGAQSASDTADDSSKVNTGSAYL